MDAGYGDGSELPYIRDTTMTDSYSFFTEAFPSDLLNERTLDDPFLDTQSSKGDAVDNSRGDSTAPANSISSPEGSAQDSSDDTSVPCERKPSYSPSAATGARAPRASDVVRPSNWRGGRIDQPLQSPTYEQDLEISNRAMEVQFDFDSAANSPSTYTSAMSGNPGRYVAIPRDSVSPAPSNMFPSPIAMGLGQSPHSANVIDQVSPNALMNGSPTDDFMDMTNLNGQMPALAPGMRALPEQPTTMQPQELLNPPPTQSPRSKMNVYFDSIKTRVETQITVRLGLYPAPKGAKRLRLPDYTIGKAKLFAPNPTFPAPDMLELSTVVVSHTAMQEPGMLPLALAMAARSSETKETEAYDQRNPLEGGPVSICSACVDRERKRSHRKKVKEADEEARFLELETKRILIFNTAEIQEWAAPSNASQASKPQKAKATTTEAAPPPPQLPLDALQLDLPTRIPCYGRHHHETEGFRVIFTIRDYNGVVVAQEISPRLVITDDHKDKDKDKKEHFHAPMQSPTDLQVAYPHAMPAPSGPPRNAYSTTDLHALQGLPDHSQANGVPFVAPQGWNGVMMPPGAYSRQVSPSMNEHRSKKRKSSAGAVVPEELRMTSMAAASSSSHNNWAPVTSPTISSPYSAGRSPVAQHHQPLVPFIPSPPTPNGDIYSTGMNGFHQSLVPRHRPTHSLPGSAHGSRATSPSASRMRQSSGGELNHIQSHAAIVAAPSRSPLNPTIMKVVPPRGPIGGGIEVSIIGHEFHEGLQVVFGTCPAVTKFIGSNAIVCQLPPSYTATVVPVTLMNTAKAARSHVPPIQRDEKFFEYENDEEDIAVKLALQLLARKRGTNVQTLLGRMLSEEQSYPGDIAMGTSGGGAHDGLQDTEGAILQILELVDLDDSELETDLNLQRDNGQALLHIAASLGFIRLVAGLLARGANPDLTDCNGNTPMHLAAMHGHALVVRKLRTAKADSELRTLRGFTPADMASTPEVLAILRPPRSRSQSIQSDRFGHSRASSISAISARGISLARTDSLHDTAIDGDDEASTTHGLDSDLSVRGGAWPRSRRNSTGAGPGLDANATEEGGSLIAWRNSLLVQIQHYQEMASRGFPNLQLPNFPAMPNLPENYQAALRSFVPRSGNSSDGESAPSSKEGRFRIFESMWPPRADPPAYSDLFPSETGHDGDAKIGSALQAATDAAADQKCATLYDQPSVSSSTMLQRNSESMSSRTIKSRGVHTPLMIGGAEATPEQLQELRAARAERQKGLKKDVKLFVFWIPVLVLIVCTVIANRAPHAIRVTKELYDNLFANRGVGDFHAIQELQAGEA